MKLRTLIRQLTILIFPSVGFSQEIHFQPGDITFEKFDVDGNVMRVGDGTGTCMAIRQDGSFEWSEKVFIESYGKHSAEDQFLIRRHLLDYVENYAE